MKFNIVSPIGGFGNHVRLLMLLDTQIFKCRDQIDFIKNNIYHAKRTWHNWLIIEWRFREILNKYAFLTHNFDDIDNPLKTVILTIDPNLAYKSYLKFNNNLNNTTVEDFLKFAKLENEKHTSLASEKIKVLSSDILFNETLDRTFYNELVEFLDSNNLYDQACEIHQLWYQAHKRAEREIVEHFTLFYKY